MKLKRGTFKSTFVFVFMLVSADRAVAGECPAPLRYTDAAVGALINQVDDAAWFEHMVNGSDLSANEEGSGRGSGPEPIGRSQGAPADLSSFMRSPASDAALRDRPIDPATAAAMDRYADKARELARYNKTHYRCAEFFKNAAGAAGFVPRDQRPRGNGWEVGPALERSGRARAVPLDPRTGLPYGASSLRDLRPGAFVVYKRTNCRGGRQCYGHVEAVTKDGFASDFHSRTPVTGSSYGARGNNHEVVGVYVWNTDR